MPQFLRSATKDMSFHLACLLSKTFSHLQGFSWRGFGGCLGTWCLLVACMLGYPGQANESSKLWSLKSLLVDTLVIWGGECGRIPPPRGRTGGSTIRTPSPSEWLVVVFLEGSAMVPPMSKGYYALRDKVHVHDLHATFFICWG